MRRYASGPQGTATRPAWKDEDLPVLEGDVQTATLQMLWLCEPREGDVELVFEPLLGLGAYAGQVPMTMTDLERAGVETRDRMRWITSQMQEAAAKAGPPKSLVDAVECIRELTVIGVEQLSDLWQEEGATETRLHPVGVLKVASLFGVTPGWCLVSDSKRTRWPADLVVVVDRLEEVHQAATSLKEAFRARRLMTLEDAQALTDLTGEEVRRLVDGCGWLAGKYAVDSVPRGLDHGMGRAFASVENRSLTVEVLHEALRRWNYDSKSRAYDWDQGQLEQYLGLSPLFDADGDGWVAIGDWARMSRLDETVVEAMNRAGGEVTLPGLIELLTGLGMTVGAAEHVAAISPVLRRTGRGRYALLT